MSGAGRRKRPTGGDSTFGPPEKKKGKKEKTTTTLIEPFRKGKEEMDMKVIAFKNKKLCEHLGQRQVMEDELRGKIEKLEKRQTTDDTILLIVNRYWSQLEESVHVLSQRLKPEPQGCQPPGPPGGMVETPAPTELVWEHATDALVLPPLSENVRAYLATLDHSSEEELSLQLQDLMQFSKEAIACLVCAFDRLHSCIYELCHHVQAAVCEDDSQSDIVCLNRTLMEENGRLQDLAFFLQGRHHKMSMEYNKLVDKVTSSETRVSEMEATVGHLQWDIEKLSEREQKLKQHLTEALDQVNTASNSIGSSGGLPGGQKITLTIQTFQSLNFELEHNQKLANSRMAEIEKLHLELQEAVREREKLEMDLRNIPEEVVKETTEFKCLQFQFSLLFSESVGVKTQLDKAQALLLSAKNSHLQQIKRMKSDELSFQKKLRTKVVQLEDMLAQVCKEYVMLHMEFELHLAANEQAGPTSREERHLISSLQNYNLHLTGDVHHYKRKLLETQLEINKLRCLSGDTAAVLILGEMTSDSTNEKKVNKELEHEEKRRKELERQHAHERERDAKREHERECERERQRSEELKWKDSNTLKMMRAELKKAQESQKEIKLLLDMYESGPKGKRDKVHLMAAERKSKDELDELRMSVREAEERERKESKKLANEDTPGKIRVAEETIVHLQKKLTATKKEQEALMSELDVTGQAFEYMHEQNKRLMLQLKEKDNTNFQLMSELNKSNQFYKQLREQKEELGKQVLTFKTQMDTQQLVVQKLEEKKVILQNSLAALENELGVRTQAVESSKRKAVEAAQLVEELKVQLEHTQTKLKEIHVSVAEKRSARERESGNLKRAQEVLSRLRRKLEKQKKVEFYQDADEILQEEINQYKAKLQCPCCNTRDKDTVLTKCFHVFCYECLKTRYDTRQRKCPMCNCAFGASDFHRIYIS